MTYNTLFTAIIVLMVILIEYKCNRQMKRANVYGEGLKVITKAFRKFKYLTEVEVRTQTYLELSKRKKLSRTQNDLETN